MIIGLVVTLLWLVSSVTWYLMYRNDRTTVSLVLGIAGVPMAIGDFYTYVVLGAPTSWMTLVSVALISAAIVLNILTLSRKTS